MKKRVILLLTAALLCVAISALGEADDSRFPGVWLSDNAAVVLWEAEDGLRGAALLEAEGDVNLRSYTAGQLDENGTLCFLGGAGSSAGAAAENLTADFSISQDGALVWSDSEDFSQSKVLRAVDSSDIRHADLLLASSHILSGYFEPILALPIGTAGSSLKIAQSAANVAQFAAESDLASAELSTLAGELFIAWSALDAEWQSEFSEAFEAVSSCIETAFSNWESSKGLFEDAGVGEQMGEIVQDPDSQEAWERFDALTRLLITQ